MTDRDRILARLKALLSMTVDNGASEQEAMLAAQKAADLMAEHQMAYVSIEEIEAENYRDDARPWFRGRKGHAKSGTVPPVVRCLPGICDLCGVEHRYCTWTGDLAFFGPAHATEAAHYLVTIIARAMENEWRAYKSRLNSARGLRSARASFFIGISWRVARRLHDMHAEQQTAMKGASTALVVVQNALVKERFAAAHPNVKQRATDHKPKHSAGVYAGWEAGANVPLNQGITESSGSKIISKGETA